MSRALAGVGVPQQIEPFGVGRHEAVLDAVVHHLHEVAGAARAAVQIAVRGRAALGGVSFGAAGCERREQRRETRRRRPASPPIMRQ